MTAEYRDHEEDYLNDYDDVEISQNAAGAHPKGAMQIRNREMVDRSDLVIFCVERSSGGAYQTMKYAMKQERIIFNLCLSEIQGNENDKFNEHISSDRNLNHSI